MVIQELERIVMVNLYEVIESGYHIHHDSPAIGCWEDYGHWTKHHGLYYKEDIAKDVQKRVLESLAKTHNYSTTEFGVDIKKIMIPESDLVCHQGAIYHIKEKQLLEVKYADI